MFDTPEEKISIARVGGVGCGDHALACESHRSRFAVPSTTDAVRFAHHILPGLDPVNL